MLWLLELTLCLGLNESPHYAPIDGDVTLMTSIHLVVTTLKYVTEEITNAAVSLTFKQLA